MGKWADIKNWNKRRKKGLKNPITLWIISFALTFILTIFPSVLVSALSAKNSSILLSNDSWTKAIVDNLYPMIIAQSVVTMLQNISIATPSKTKEKTRQFVPHISWTYWLIVSLILYMIAYPALVYASPSWRNLALYIISGVLAAVGLGSVLQLSHEQEQIHAAIEKERREKEQLQKVQRLQDNGRDLAWNSPPTVLPDADNPSAEAGEVSHNPAFK